MKELKIKNVTKRLTAAVLSVMMMLSGLAYATPVWAEETENAATEAESVHYKGEGFRVDVTVDAQWENHYNATVEITNTGSENIENWTLAFDSEDHIENIWNATVESGDKKEVRIKNAGWNQDIAPGSSVSFGYTASCDGGMHLAKKYKILSAEKEVEEGRRNVTFEIESEWDEGSVVRVTIENKSETPVEDWCLSFDAPYEIETIWNGIIVSKDNGTYVIKNSGHNSTIAPNGTVEFGFKIKGKYVEAENITVTEINPEEGTGNNGNDDDKDGDKDDKPVTDGKARLISVQASQNMVLTGSVSSVRIWAETAGLDPEAGYEVDLYFYNEEQWEKVTSLYDTGMLDENGDEIKNDGIYSQIIDINESEETTLKYKVILSCKGEDLDSSELEIVVKQKLSQADCELYLEVNQILAKYVSEQLEKSVSEGNSKEMAADIKELFENQKVKAVSVVDDWTVCVTLENGLFTYVQIADDTDKELMRRGSGSSYIDAELDNFEDFDPEDYEDDEDYDDIDPDELNALETVEEEYGYNFVLSNRVLLWNPFDTEWGESDETEIVKLLEEESAGTLDVDIVSDEKADAASLEKITDYGLVILASHGLEGKWLVTGEKFGENLVHESELVSGEMSVFIRGELEQKNTQMNYMVNKDWFNNHLENNFPNSVIINNSCTSLETEDFWDVFSSKGAKTYYGYTGAVTNDYVVLQTGDLLVSLLCEGDTTQEAYDYSYDRQYGEGAYFGIRGYGNMAFQIGMMGGGIMNGGFEEGLSGWQKEGDGRSISHLGNIVPTEGNHMGIISTGLGYTQELGEISQKLTVPEEATKLSFDWNFLSEEFLTYIGSYYDDPFEVSLILKDESQKKHTLISMDVNSIAEDFDADIGQGGKLIHVSPAIVFDHGDVWMTGWQKADVDISAYAGQQVTLTFSVKDAVDTVYTTAVLLDRIMFDQGNLVSCEGIEVSDEYSDEMFRTLYSKGAGAGKGRSYVFYSDEFKEHVDAEKDRIKSAYGYQSLKQVTAVHIKTGKDFLKNWNAMPDDKVDRVSLMFHGRFYCITLENGDAILTCPNRKSFLGRDSLHIEDLNKKTIDCINILSCTCGMLDAINYNNDVTLKIEGKNHTNKVKGNVAQTFLESQNVTTVKAWDGSLAYSRINHKPRLSNKQEEFQAYRKALEKKRVFKPIRGPRMYPGGKNSATLLPKSKLYPSDEWVTYEWNKKGKKICTYSYQCRQYYVMPANVVDYTTTKKWVTSQF